MSNSSILGGSAAPTPASGKDVDALGPSDTSDSGSDVQGERAMATGPDNPGEWGSVVADMDSDSDSGGTGERASADGESPRDGADLMPDRIIEDLGADDDPSNRRESVEAADLAADDDELEDELDEDETDADADEPIDDSATDGSADGGEERAREGAGSSGRAR